VVNGREVRSQYDASGNRTEMTSSLGARVVTSRDGLGLPRELFFGRADGFAEPDVRFDRDGLGLEARRAFKNGIDVEWSRDVAGRPTARRTFKRTLAAAMGAFAAAMVATTPSFAAGQPPREELNARVYQWRGEDQIAAIVDATSGPKFYDHDRRGRLIRERRPDAVVDRAMDAVGNVYRTADGRDRRYGKGGRLEQADGVRYEHDEDGNQTLKSGPDGDWHYRWNGHGMLREVERPDGVRVQFEYDPFARRTAKRTLAPTGTIAQEVQFVWDGHNVVHELDSERGLISWQWEPESFTPIAKEHAGRRWTIASDHLGTPTEMYDEVGQLAWKMQLDVFGVPSFEAGTAEDCPWRWPGQYEDGGTGLFYNRWRYYTSHGAAFCAMDPVGLAGGWRSYAYVTDPIAWVDVLGLTGTYIFEFASGEMYIGKGPIDRARTSQRGRATEIGTTTGSITHGAHADFSASAATHGLTPNQMGLMVEAELMSRHGFGTASGANLLNAINSPGRNLLVNATPAQRAAIVAEANALQTRFSASVGCI
jgi:RHS repeat-associated protein